MSSYEFRSSFT